MSLKSFRRKYKNFKSVIADLKIDYPNLDFVGAEKFTIVLENQLRVFQGELVIKKAAHAIKKVDLVKNEILSLFESDRVYRMSELNELSAYAMLTVRKYVAMLVDDDIIIKDGYEYKLVESIDKKTNNAVRAVEEVIAGDPESIEIDDSEIAADDSEIIVEESGPESLEIEENEPVVDEVEPEPENLVVKALEQIEVEEQEINDLSESEDFETTIDEMIDAAAEEVGVEPIETESEIELESQSGFDATAEEVADTEIEPSELLTYKAFKEVHQDCFEQIKGKKPAKKFKNHFNRKAECLVCGIKNE